ncbi:MAG: MHYT domain-containing protein [Rhizobiaceae bacterium]|nr:MHYT domain-containing protein [Rhizobiaceae bacterium]
MLHVAHNHWLVAASLMIAIIAGFTGLSLLKGASQTSIEKRKFNVALASIAMGGGIWSMHFVAMLGLQLPIPFFYEILTTLASALIAILVVGMALLIVHFVKRDRKTMVASGLLVGIGIVVMHYLGMSGMHGAEPEFTTVSIIVTIFLACIFGVITFFAAYSQRNSGNIMLGSFLFGIAVFSVHFVAMRGTVFQKDATNISEMILISNEVLAIGVSLTTFVICGAFLLTGITFVAHRTSDLDAKNTANDVVINQIATIDNAEAASAVDGGNRPTVRMPYEKDGRSYFATSDSVCVIRAEGHYTYIYISDEKLFCPWSISEAKKRLSKTHFINCHRSYLINPAHVSEFERKKDNGVCYFRENLALEKVPVSRSKLKDVREALGLV